LPFKRDLQRYTVACAITAVLLEDEGLNPDGVIDRLCRVVPGVNPAHVRICAADIDAFRIALSSTQLLQ
jgi:hypothetical protein